MKWRDSRYQLPKEDIMVLCFCESEPIGKYQIASYDYSHEVFFDYDEYPVEATHWMPLSKQP